MTFIIVLLGLAALYCLGAFAIGMLFIHPFDRDNAVASRMLLAGIVALGLLGLLLK